MTKLLLISAAQAMAAAPSQGGEGTQNGGSGGAQLIIFIVGFILIFYFLMLRPQKKQQKERQNMLDNIKKGDRIQTNGGLLGIVTAVDQKEITLRIAPEVRVKVARAAIAGVVRQTADSPAESGKGQSDKPDLEKKDS
ncbi:MAG: preprotein translocase subunit YajC [Deltaproteobacteria bacterium]|jgi:preprotein translocase subunit YajC|nr:preprotein translocase subunit YajC [Deltaproteobacteria bacterium]